MTNANQVRARMALLLKQPEHRLTDEMLLSDLVTDSFALIDMVIELQDELDVLLMQEDLKSVKTVGELLAVIQTKMTVSDISCTTAAADKRIISLTSSR